MSERAAVAEPFALRPVATRTLSDEVADSLRESIRSGALPPGVRLVERDIAAQLGVSRIPVREAIQRLAEEGLVRKTPHRGTFVYSPTRAEIEQISSLRVVLERFVVERVVERWQPKHETQLRRIVKRMRRAAAQRDMRQVYELDYDFHRTLWEIADHELLLEVISGLRARISRFLYEANGALANAELDQHIDSHDYFIDILKSREVEPARAEIAQHILGAKQRILTYVNLPESTE
jgi:DNA-binding GntR family transcriptional regulator